MRESIVYKQDRCSLCGCVGELAPHEIFFGTANRKKSIQDKMIAYLCFNCHTGTRKAVHKNRENDLILKYKGQEVWEKTYGNREEFIKRYGKSWL